MLTFLKRIFLSERGTASASKSVFYQNTVVNKYPYDTSGGGGRVVAVRFEHVVGAGTYVTGTTDTVSGTVKLFTHPKGWAFVGLFASTDGLSASAGVGQTPVIGDGTTADKYMLASDFDASAGIGLPNGASYGYTPTVDKPVTLTYGATGTPVATKKVFGTFFFVPGS
jgi:hypothetical protein